MVRCEAHDRKAHGLPTAPFVKELEGVINRPFDRWYTGTQLPTKTKPYNSRLTVLSNLKTYHTNYPHDI